MSLTLMEKRREQSQAGYFRIGDVVLDVPPETIETVRLSNNEEITALRGRMPMFKKTGHERFDVIINWKAFLDWTAEDPYEQYEKVRRLVAFSRAAPFIEVENAHLRQIVQHDRLMDTDWSRMAFGIRQVRVSTVPDMADAVQVNLHLTWFNYRPYSASFAYLGGGNANQSPAFTAFIDRWMSQNLNLDYKSLREWDLDLSWRIYEVFRLDQDIQERPGRLSTKPQDRLRPQTPAKNIGTSRNKSAVPLLNVAGAKVTSRFGSRRLPGESAARLHAGIDIAGVPAGTEIPAPAAGRVTFSGNQRGYGNIVVLRHSSRVETVYAHLKDIKAVRGQDVRAGDVIGTVGNTGRSVGATGVHLHYEVIIDGKQVDPETVTLTQLSGKESGPQPTPQGIPETSEPEAKQPATVVAETELPQNFMGMQLDHYSERAAFYYATEQISIGEDDESLYPVQIDVAFLNNLIPVPVESHVMPTYQHIGSPKTVVSVSLLSNGEHGSDAEPVHSKLSSLASAVQDLDQQFHYLRAEWRSISSLHRMQALSIRNRLLAMLGVQSILPASLTTETVPSSPSLVQAVLMGPEYTNVYEELKGYRIKNPGQDYQKVWSNIIDGELLHNIPDTHVPAARIKQYAYNRKKLDQRWLAGRIKSLSDSSLGVAFPFELQPETIAAVKDALSTKNGKLMGGVLPTMGANIPAGTYAQRLSDEYPKMASRVEAGRLNYDDYLVLQAIPSIRDHGAIQKIRQELKTHKTDESQLLTVCYERLFERMLVEDPTFLKNLQVFETYGPVAEAFKNVNTGMPGADPENEGHGAYRDLGFRSISGESPSPALYFADESARLAGQFQAEIEVPLERGSTIIESLNLPETYGATETSSDPEATREFLKTALSRAKVPAVSMSRAFPALKLFFMEEDNEGIFYAYDDFYSYNSVLGVEIGRSIDKPDIAVVTISNFSNILSQRFFDNSVWGRMERLYDRFRIERGVTSTGEAVVGPGMDNTTALAQESRGGINLSAGFPMKSPGQKAVVPKNMLQYLGLQPGTKVQIRAGFDNDPDKLFPVFTGYISEIESGEIMTIVCQGYMAELMQMVDDNHEEYKQNLGGAFRFWAEPGDALHVITKMLSISKATHFGRWQIDRAATPFMRTFGRKPLEFIPDVTGLTPDSRIGRAIGFSLGIYSHGRARHGDNIRISRFLSGNGQTVLGNGTYYSGRPYSFEQTWKQTLTNAFPAYKLPDYKTPKNCWEVIRDVARRYPDQILAVKPYGFPFQADATLVFAHPNDIYMTRESFIGEAELDKLGEFHTEIFDRWWNHQGGRQQFNLRLKALGDMMNTRSFANDFYTQLRNHITDLPVGLNAEGAIMEYINRGGIKSFNRVWQETINMIDMLYGRPTKDQSTGQFVAAAIRGLMPDAVSRQNFYHAREMQQVFLALKRDFARHTERSPNSRMQPVRKWHMISGSQIIKNGITLYEDVYNAVKISESVLPASDHIPSEARRILDVTESIILPDENCSTDQMKELYAQSFLRDQVAKMYQGDLVLFGSPDIEPFDVLVIADPVRQIHGPIEVESVSHLFDQESGFITVVRPRALVLVNERLGAGIAATLLDFVRGIPNEFSSLLNHWTGDQEAGSPGLGEIERDVLGITAGSTAAGTAMAGYFTVKGARAAARATAGASAAASATATTAVSRAAAARLAGLAIPGVNALLVASSIYAGSATFYSMALKRHRANPLFLLPLLQYDSPYVGGIQGWQVSDLATLVANRFKYLVATEIYPTIEAFKEWQGLDLD